MKRKLSRSGNGWSIFVPKVIIELLGLNPEADQIEMEVENKTLKIQKAEKINFYFSSCAIYFPKLSPIERQFGIMRTAACAKKAALIIFPAAYKFS